MDKVRHGNGTGAKRLAHEAPPRPGRAAARPGGSLKGFMSQPCRSQRSDRQPFPAGLRCRMVSPVPESTSKTPRGVKRYAGRAIYIYAFDVAYEMARQPLTQLLGQPVAQFSVDTSHRNPRHLFFFRPQMVR